MRTYLGELGVTRHELMRILDEPSYQEPPGLAPESAQLISDVAPAAPWELWGLDETVSGLRDARDGSTVSGPWVTVLTGRISLLLQLSGLDLVELRDLLDTRFVNPAGHRPDHRGPACDLTKRGTPWLDAAHLTRMVRFVRLAHAIGWHVHELDRATTAYGADALTPDFLRWLAHAHHLASMLKLRPTDVAAWWSRIDTRGYVDHSGETEAAAPSPYDQLFLNRTVVSPGPPVPGIERRPDRTGQALPGTGRHGGERRRDHHRTSQRHRPRAGHRHRRSRPPAGRRVAR